MKTNFNVNTGQREWVLDRWTQKATYVIGYISIISSVCWIVVGLFAVAAAFATL